MNFQFAAVARAGVDLADGQRAAETGKRRAIDALRKLRQRSLVWRWRRLGERPVCEAFEQRLAHDLQIVSGIRAVE